MKSNPKGMTLIVAAIVVTAGTFLAGCGGGGGTVTPPPNPSILNINSSTNPSSPVGLPIEINGSGFLSAPGKVVFTQGSIVATVVPSAAGWSDTGLVATVPTTGDNGTPFTVPGSVTVTVVTSGGTSNGVALTLVQSLTFNPSNFAWATTTSLPTALTGLRAVAVPVNATNAFVVVAGGFNATNNSGAVYSSTLASAGTLGPWTPQGNSLPSPRAHFGMVEADPGNSLVAAGSRFIYVIGGQVNSSDTPGGMANVFVASVDVTSGAVGGWTELTASPLPQPLVGPAATLFNGYIYVVGGLTTTGAPSAAVYSAKVQSDGTLSAWSTSANPYPVAISFAPAFGFGGNLYVLGGDSASSTNPNDQGSQSSGISNVNFASARNGVVGTWTPTTQIKGRKKQISWTAFGQVINGEGIYTGFGQTGSNELETSGIQADSTLGSWNGLTGSKAPGANVYNPAAFVSPLQSPAATPRFLLLGGQAFVTTGTGAPSAKVFFNSAP